MRQYKLLLCALLALSSCGDQKASSTPTATVVGATPALGSKFARIHVGMSKGEVQSIIGPPTDENMHLTPKVAIPFYFGSDTREVDAHYKNEGVLTYASRGVVNSTYDLKEIKVDPAEPGFVK